MKLALALSALLISGECISQTAEPTAQRELSSSTQSEVNFPKKMSQRDLAPSPLDHQMAWDQFSHRGKLIWACRGSQTGDFVAASYCTYAPKVDSKWPDKKTPKGYSGVPDLE
jgi:hypothetical protein